MPVDSQTSGPLQIHRITMPPELDASDPVVAAYLDTRRGMHRRYLWFSLPFWLIGIVAMVIFASWVWLLIVLGAWLIASLWVSVRNHGRLQEVFRTALQLPERIPAEARTATIERVAVRRAFLRKKLSGDAPSPDIATLLKGAEADGHVFYLAEDAAAEDLGQAWQALREPVVIKPLPWTLILLLVLGVGVGLQRDWDWLWMVNITIFGLAYLVLVLTKPQVGARYWFVPGGCYEQLSVWRGSRVRHIPASNACLWARCGGKTAEVFVLSQGEQITRLDLTNEQIDEVLGAWCSPLEAPRPEGLGEGANNQVSR